MPWPTIPLLEACEINVGRTPSRSRREYWGEGEPWLSIADMKQGRCISVTKETVTPLAAKEAVARPVATGTVLLSFKLSIGKVGIAQRQMFTNEAIAALPIRPGIPLEPEYLARALESMSLAEGSSRAAMGATLNKASLSRIPIPLPPIAEQRRIAAILDQADALRTKRREALALLDDLTQSIFIDMFMVPGSVSEHKAIGEALNFKSGSFLPAKDQLPGPIPVYGGNGVNGSHDRPLFLEPVVVIGRVGAYCGAVHLTQGPSWVTDNALYVSSNPLKFSLNYLSHALSHLNLNQYSSQSGQPLISGSRIASATIGVPSSRLQKEFDLRLLSLDRAKEDCITARQGADELFKSLQVRAFLGQL